MESWPSHLWADEDAERLRRIAQLIGAETLEEAIRFLLKLAEERGVSLTCGRDSLASSGEP